MASRKEAFGLKSSYRLTKPRLKVILRPTAEALVCAYLQSIPCATLRILARLERRHATVNCRLDIVRARIQHVFSGRN